MSQSALLSTPQGSRADIGRIAEQTCVPSQQFCEAMSFFSTAVSIITTDGPAGRAGMTCSSVCSISAEPALVGFCVARDAGINTTLKTNGVLCISSLRADQQKVSQIFAGVGQVPQPERFEHGCWDTLATGAPYMTDALMALDGELVDVREIGSHSLFVARVVATATTGPAEPLVYQQRQYATIRPI